MLDMTPNDMTYLTKHLSHGLKIHENYYQTMCDVVERTKVGLLLTLKDAGKLEQFRGKRIEDITIAGIYTNLSVALHVIS